MTTKKRGRPPIKPIIENVICDKARNTRTPPPALAVELKHLIEEMGYESPAEETLKKRISHYRNLKESPLDAPWSMTTLEKYPLPPEALPTVLQIWKRRKDSKAVYGYVDLLTGDIIREADNPLTIRQAKWIGRLYAFQKNISLDELDWFSGAYCRAERSSEFTGQPFDDHSIHSALFPASRLAEQLLEAFLGGGTT